MIAAVEIITLYIMITLWLDGKMSIGTIVLIQTYMVIVANNLWEFEILSLDS